MSSKQQQILDTAARLFNQFGFHATGVDKIVAESGVTKRTLYKSFSSKEKLILQVLKQRDISFLQNIEQQVALITKNKYAGQQEAQLLALFDAFTLWFKQKDFYGCNFINATAEYSDPNHPIQQMSKQHKLKVRGYIKGLLPDNLDQLLDPICLLLEGAIVLASTCGDKGAAEKAKVSVISLLKTLGVEVHKDLSISTSKLKAQAALKALKRH